jgi:hypothetical protein
VLIIKKNIEQGREKEYRTRNKEGRKEEGGINVNA